MIYIHGYTEGLQTKSVQTVISAYQKRNDTNILLLNWQNYSSGNYLTDAISHAIGVSYVKLYKVRKSRNFLWIQIGNLIGIRIFYWITNGVLDNEKLHIVGKWNRLSFLSIFMI